MSAEWPDRPPTGSPAPGDAGPVAGEVAGARDAPSVGDNQSVDDWDGHWGDFSDAASANPAQAYRRRLIVSLMELDGIPRRLVDIGSGQGDLLASLESRWPRAELLGLELSAEGIRRAAAKAPRARFLQRNLLEDAPTPTALAGWGTAAVCSEVLEHVDDPAALLRNASAFLTPGARVVVTVPGGPRTAFDRHIGHRRHFTRAELRAVLEGAGLEVERVSGSGFPFFNLYKLVVLARGEGLVSSAAAVVGPPSRPARLAMTAFGVLFRANLRSTPLGWQLTAVARTPS